MSDINPATKSPLWKQLVGALAGAAVAFVLYQGYTFSANVFMAAVAIPDLPRPTGTLDAPVAKSSSVSSRAVVSASSSAQKRNTVAVAFRKSMRLSSAASQKSAIASSVAPVPMKAAVIARKSSVSSRASAKVVTQPVLRKAATVRADTATRTKLPQTGFGLDVIAVSAIGAAIGRRKMLKKSAK